jgi:hypothetical protein
MIETLGYCSTFFMGAWLGLSAPVWFWQTLKRALEQISDDT